MYFTQFQDFDPYTKHVKMHHLIEFIQHDRRLFYLYLPIYQWRIRGGGVPVPLLFLDQTDPPYLREINWTERETPTLAFWIRKSFLVKNCNGCHRMHIQSMPG